MGHAAGPGLTDDPALVARHPIRIYDERDGVGTFPFECLAEDAKGYLWCGTQDGIQRYNGHEWTHFALPETTRSNWVCSIQPARDGGIWFGTNGNGLHHWKDGAWTSYTIRTGFPGLWVPSLAETVDSAGQAVLWIGTGKEGLWKATGGRLEPVPMPGSPVPGAVNALLAARDGSLWVGSQKGLFHVDQGRWSNFGPGDLGRPSLRVTCLAETGDPAGSELWVGTDQGLSLLRKGAWRTLTQEQGLPSNYISALAVEHGQDGQAVLWAATDRGVGILRAGRWSLLDNRRGLPSNIIRALLITERPKAPTLIWIGTFSGLARMAPGKWLSFTTASGLTEALVFATFEAEDHSYWFATGGGGLLHLARGVWTAQDAVEGHAITTVFTLCPGHGAAGRKVLYAGSRDAGVLVWEAGHWHMWAHNAELPQPSVYALLETRDPSGAPVLWVGTRGGLVRAGRDGLQVIEKGTGLGHDHVTALAETKDGQGRSILWVGTRGGGVSRFWQGKWDTYGETGGLHEGRVASLTVIKEPSGRSIIWVGTHSNGVARFDPEHPEQPWVFLPEAERLQIPSRNVESIQADAKGRVYLFTLGGVTRMTPQADGRFAFTTYTMGDGLPSNTCTMGSSMVDSQGRLWTGTVAGVAFLDPALEPEDSAPKHLQFERCTEVGGGGNLLEGAVLSHRQNHLRFEFSLFSFFGEAETRYRVQMAGLDPAPGPWRAEPRQDYVSLPDGKYTFKVWARDHAGNVTGPIALSFRIRPAPWRHPLAYLGYAALLIGAGWAYSRLRIGILRARNLELRTRIKEATAALLARESQLKLQAEHLAAANAGLQVKDEEKNRFLGIAAHDLRNPLSGIALTARLILEKDDPDHIDRDLNRIIATARTMSDLLDRFLDVTAIEAGKVDVHMETLDLATLPARRAQEFLTQAQAKGLELRVAAADQALWVRCDPRFLDQILDNLLSNAIKFSPRDRLIQVQVEDTGTGGRLSVRDQGPGLTPDDLEHLFGRFTKLSARPTGGEASLGLGLSIVKGMVDAMGGTIRVESQPGNGACFIVELPKG